MSCSCSLVRVWNATSLSALLLAAPLLVATVQIKPARGDDRPPGQQPAARQAPAAEDILDEVLKENSRLYAPPPSPRRREKVTRLAPQDFKIENKSSTQMRVHLPANQALLTPAVADGRVFVGGGFNSTEFYCISAESGRTLWGVKLSDNGPSAPAYESGTLSFTTESCTLYVLDAATGNCLWSTWLGDPLITAPSIAGDRVLVCYPASESGGYRAKPKSSFVFAARELRTGKPLWQRWIDENVISAPVVSGDDIYLTTFAGTLYGFRLISGDVKLALRCRGTSAPIVTNKTIYVSRRVDDVNDKMPQECVVSFDRRTGAPLKASQNHNAIYLAEAGERPKLIEQQTAREKAGREKAAAETSSLGSGGPARVRLVANMTVSPDDPDYVPGGTPPVADTRADSIKLVGRTGALDLQRFDGARLTMLGGKLFNCMGDDLLSLDPRTGRVRWSVPLPRAEAEPGESLAMPPSSAAGRLFVATRSGELLRLEPRSGSIDARIAIGSPLTTQPVFDDGQIVVGSASGELIMFRSNDRTLTGWNQWGGNAVHSGVGAGDKAEINDWLADEDVTPVVLRSGRELADATRTALRKLIKVKTSDADVDDARQELAGIYHELERDTELPQTVRDNLQFAVRHRMDQLGGKTKGYAMKR